MTVSPATPSAFGCTACLGAAKAQRAAENATRRLLQLASGIQQRDDELRAENAALEAENGRLRALLGRYEEVSA
jgi:regulator of replication initiation timing